MSRRESNKGWLRPNLRGWSRPAPTMDECKRRFAEAMLDELKRGEMSWYYTVMFSEAGGELAGGVVIRAVGVMHAFEIVHRQGWYEEGCATDALQLADEQIAMIPASMRWRSLTREEVRDIGERIAVKPKRT